MRFWMTGFFSINICLIQVLFKSQTQRNWTIGAIPVFLILIFVQPVAEFKEFERRFKFKPRFKYGWFQLKLYQMFQDLSRRLI